MKKYLKFISIVLMFIFCFAGCLDDEEVRYDNRDTASRELRTVLKGNGEDTATIMIYMCGSDLEEENEAATSDIQEMLNADLSDKVNVVIETGGARKWHNGISGSNNQIYTIKDNNLVLLKDLPLENMASKDTLSEFISYCKDNYTADRYELIMWDHGGGAISGYGVDSNFPDESMGICDMGEAIKNSGVTFDFVGFDACLMGTIETGLMLEEYADYMIASEETEPACGWYYTDWLTEFSQNTSMDTKELGKKIIDDYVGKCGDEAYFEQAVLSIADLTKVKNVYSKLCEFAKQADDELTNHNFEKISKARSETKSFADGEVDHIDLSDFASNTELQESQELQDAVDDCICYNNNTFAVWGASGLSMYFPYTELEYFDDMTTVYNRLKLNEDYTKFMNHFINIMAGGQENYTGTSSPMEALNAGNSSSDSYSAGGQANNNWQDSSWYDEETVSEYDDYYGDYGYEELEISEKGDEYILEMSDEDWEEISNIDIQVLYDDGEGYLDLGYDNVYETDEEGNLKITFDNTWVCINEQVVPYYDLESKETEEGWTNYGYVPAEINGKEVEIVITFSDKCPEGKILGYKYGYGEDAMCLKGLMPINEGDTVEFICDFYTYNQEYESSYSLGDPITVDSNGLELSYCDIGDGTCLVYYRITDIYGNDYWTEPVEFS